MKPFRKALGIKILLLSLALLFLGACQTQESASPEPVDESVSLTQDQILVLGDVSGDPSYTIEHFQPLADYLAENLSEFGIQQGKVVVTSDLETMLEHLKSGEVNVYFDSPYPALEVYETINAIPLARRWKDGVSEYYSVIVVHKDSGITGLEGLLGKLIAFDHPASTSGFLLPKAYLAVDGYQANEKENTDAEIGLDEIGYTFAYGEETEALWVIEGKAAAAAFSNGDFDNLAEEQRSQLTIIAQTPPVPRHIALGWPGMSSDFQAKLTELLLNLHTTPEGQEILQSFEETSKFDEFPVEAFKALQELFAPVR